MGSKAPDPPPSERPGGVSRKSTPPPPPPPKRGPLTTRVTCNYTVTPGGQQDATEPGEWVLPGITPEMLSEEDRLRITELRDHAHNDIDAAGELDPDACPCINWANRLLNPEKHDG